MRAGTVKDDDRKWKRMLRTMKSARKAHVTVGFHSDAEPYAKGQGAAANVAQIASFHEFGEGHNPVRAFFGPTVDGKRAQYGDLLNDKITAEVIAGDVPLSRPLGLVGQKCTADIKQAIVDLVDPPLADVTIERKKARAGLGADTAIRAATTESGSSFDTGNPLIDTGHMRTSVDYKVST